MTVHEPADTNVIWPVDAVCVTTVQAPTAVKVTGSPDDAVAVTVIDPVASS